MRHEENRLTHVGHAFSVTDHAPFDPFLASSLISYVNKDLSCLISFCNPVFFVDPALDRLANLFRFSADHRFAMINEGTFMLNRFGSLFTIIPYTLNVNRVRS